MSTTVYSLANLNTYRSYFEDLVAQAVFLNFFAYTKAEFDKASSDPNRSGWCFVLEPFDATIRDNTADSVLSYNTGLFVIAKKKTAEAKSYEIEQTAQVYAHKILGRMRRDQRLRVIECKFENISLMAINPMTSSEYYGVAVSFEYYYPINKDMKYDEDDWVIEEDTPPPTPPDPTPTPTTLNSPHPITATQSEVDAIDITWSDTNS